MKWWGGRVAAILAVTIGTSWGLALVLAVGPWTGSTINSETATLLATIGGVLAGGVAGFLSNISSDATRDPNARTRAGDPTDQQPQRPQIDLSIGPAVAREQPPTDPLH